MVLSNDLQGRTVEGFARHWADQYQNAFTRLSANTIQYEVVDYKNMTQFP